MKTSTSFLKLLLSRDRSGFTIASFQRNIHLFEPEKVQFKIVPLLDLLENKHVSITSGIHEENMRNSQASFYVFTFVKMKVYILSFPCFKRVVGPLHASQVAHVLVCQPIHCQLVLCQPIYCLLVLCTPCALPAERMHASCLPVVFCQPIHCQLVLCQPIYCPLYFARHVLCLLRECTPVVCL